MIYSAPIDALAFTAATDVFEFTVATDRPVPDLRPLCARRLTCRTQPRRLRIGLYRDVTAGSTGTALHEAIYDNESPSAPVSLAVVANRGTASTGGELIDIIGWNIRIPLEKVYPPAPAEFSAIAAEGSVNSYRLLAAPTDSITVSGALYWEEI